METPGVSYHIQQKTERGRQVDINKMKPTTSAVLSDKIALSEGDHPNTSVSDLDASKKVLPNTKALIVASAEGVVLSHARGQVF